MKDISDAADLIATARESLLNELLPTLAKDQRYAGLMIANAMAIALREARSGTEVAATEIERLRALLAGVNADLPHTAGKGAESELTALRRVLCEAIREGRFDDGYASTLTAHLIKTASDWVAISNPKALRAERVAP
jgi:hypothetical protein